MKKPEWEMTDEELDEMLEQEQYEREYQEWYEQQQAYYDNYDFDYGDVKY